jgi:DNA-binding transcriptional regulator YiaG
MITLSKKDLRDRLGLDSDADLARWFEISQSAVSQWPDEGAIPKQRALEAALKRPDLFQVATHEARPG